MRALFAVAAMVVAVVSGCATVDADTSTEEGQATEESAEVNVSVDTSTANPTACRIVVSTGKCFTSCNGGLPMCDSGACITGVKCRTVITDKYGKCCKLPY